MNNPVNMEDSDGNWPKWSKKITTWVIKKVVKKIVRPAIKKVKKVLSKKSGTYSKGVGFSVSPGVGYYSVQAGISVDIRGNVAIQGGYSKGGTTGTSMGGGLTTYRTITNAPTVDLLEGTGYEFGGSAGAYIVGVPIVGGVDFNKMDDPDGKKSYYGTTTNCGIGVPGYELHSGAGETLSFSQFNIFDLLDQVCIRIME